MPKKIAVIDGNSLMHRAYHAVPNTMQAPDGTPTNAVFGFMSMLLKFIEVASPDAIVCAFDVGKPKFRIEALKQYKAQRPPMDDDLRVQFPLADEILESLSIPVIKVPGWEGDDILGTVSARCDAAGYDALLVTGDKDACQLASDHTHIVNTRKGITDVVIYDPAGVEEKYGVTPAQIPDYLGLMGDSADNIPGVPGIGPKTASKLLQQFGSMEGIYENLDKLKRKQLEHLRDNKDAAFLSRDVAVIKRDLDFPLDLDGIAFPAFEDSRVIETFGKLHFNAHLQKVLALKGDAALSDAIPSIMWEKPVHGEKAAEVLANTPADECLGVWVTRAAQDTLFGADISLGVVGSDWSAIFTGDDARKATAELLRKHTCAVLDGKAFIQIAYPADGAQDALIDVSELMDVSIEDISLAAYVLDSNRSDFSLAALCEEFLSSRMPDVAGDEVLVASAACVRVLKDQIAQRLKEDGTTSVYQDIDLPLVPVLAIMERTGAEIDVERLGELAQSTAAEISERREEIYARAGEEFNIDSPKQVGHILFEVCGFKPGKKTAHGYSTNAAVLKELAETDPLPAQILEYREFAKMKSTYIDALPRMRGRDGRLHTSFNETVTTTGRLSSSDPNLQNIPARTDFGRLVRECFIPLDPDSLFMSADYSQIELRLLAHLSGDEHLIAAFSHGADFHTQTAARVFGIDPAEVTPALRSRAKAVNFGIVYGQQAYGLSRSLRISFVEAQEMIDRYFEAYPQVRAYLDDTVAQAKKQGFALTMFGRKRHIPELSARNPQQCAFGERTAMNHPMQGSAADIIKLAMVDVQRRLLEGGFASQVMLQVHDELDLSVPKDEVEAVSALLADSMEHIVSLKVPLEVEVSYSSNWSDAH